MIITVASGKGGTGKTTVATALALAAAARARPVYLLDCDVEEPNAHLFVNPAIESERAVGILTPVVDAEKCDGCRHCAEVCSFNAIAAYGRTVLVFNELCHGCGNCSNLCPTGAIREELRPTGSVERGWAGGVKAADGWAGGTGAIHFIRGTLNVGEAMAVPVIREVKKEARDAPRGALVIIDAPPGTSCPTVECLKGADYALLVTEPTPFGLHDLKLAVEVARDQLGRRVGVIINRDGLGDGRTEDYCRGEGIPVLMKIPHDRRIAVAYSDGIPLTEALDGYTEKFRALLERLATEVGR